MESQIDAFLHLSSLFQANGFSLYLVGGTVRDFLWHLDLTDMDVVTNATPAQMKNFIPNGDYHFEKFGFVSCRFKEISFDITTLRVEKKYDDSRHPSKIIFVDSLKKDYKRRDFTINALYADDRFHIYDYCGGKKDLDNHIIRMIGKPAKRIKEDPLRILRAIRFSLLYNCHIDEDLQKKMKKYAHLLDLLNKEKIKEEINKIRNLDHDIITNIFKEFGLDKYLSEVMKNV